MSKPIVLTGLIGAGIQKSRSPSLHMREGAAQGLLHIYKIIDIDAQRLSNADLPDLLQAAKRMGFRGLNITHPCKQAVVPLLDELSSDAQALGAVNTVVIEPDGRLIGHNTDWFGFAENMKRGLPGAAMDRVVQLGAGGAGVAVAHAAMMLGTKHFSIFDVDANRAEKLASELAARFPKATVVAGTDLQATLANADGLIHATPIGMADHPGMALPAEYLHAGLWVSEVVYVPLETELVATAKRLGCRTLNGGGMAVFQAVEAFRLFTGITPDSDRMVAHFSDMIAGVSD